MFIYISPYVYRASQQGSGRILLFAHRYQRWKDRPAQFQKIHRYVRFVFLNLVPVCCYLLLQRAYYNNYYTKLQSSLFQLLLPSLLLLLLLLPLLFHVFVWFSVSLTTTTTTTTTTYTRYYYYYYYYYYLLSPRLLLRLLLLLLRPPAVTAPTATILDLLNLIILYSIVINFSTQTISHKPCHRVLKGKELLVPQPLLRYHYYCYYFHYHKILKLTS